MARMDALLLQLQQQLDTAAPEMHFRPLIVCPGWCWARVNGRPGKSLWLLWRLKRPTRFLPMWEHAPRRWPGFSRN